jgi:hypothetical protein
MTVGGWIIHDGSSMVGCGEHSFSAISRKNKENSTAGRSKCTIGSIFSGNVRSRTADMSTVMMPSTAVWASIIVATTAATTTTDSASRSSGERLGYSVRTSRQHRLAVPNLERTVPSYRPPSLSCSARIVLRVPTSSPGRHRTASYLNVRKTPAVQPQVQSRAPDSTYPRGPQNPRLRVAERCRSRRRLAEGSLPSGAGDREDAVLQGDETSMVNGADWVPLSQAHSWKHSDQQRITRIVCAAVRSITLSHARE